MNRNLLWKFLFVLFVLFWALWELYPPTSRNLIDEFQARAVNRDARLNQIIEEARKATEGNPARSFVSLREAIGTNDVSRYFPFINVKNQEDPTRAILHRLQKDAAGKIKLGLDLQGGTAFEVALDTSRFETNRTMGVEERELVLSQAVEVLRKRVDAFGVSEPIIQPLGDDRILIQLPGLSEAEKESAREQIKKAAFLEFRLVHPESDSLIQQGLGAPGYELLYVTDRDRNNREVRIPYLVKKRPEKGLTGFYVARASVQPDPITNVPQIALRFNSEGARLFAEITRENVGRQLAIVLDGELYSAPVIQQPIPSGEAVISGNFTIQEAYALANVLENPLQTELRIMSERSVEPSLGKDSIRSGMRATIIGTILVSAFMLVYYLFAGLVANVALLLNIIILLGVMASIDTVLTLPGIAGILLTIGMAVDANVLIFERMREELKAGKSLKGSVAAGYKKAFGTIFDSNVTTLISSIILIFLGTGPVQGFGVTLSIGVAVSMFTALVVTRLIFDFLLARGWLTSLPMLQMVKETHFDFLAYAKYATVASWALVVLGIGYGLYRGKDTLGVDFAGGDSVTYAFAQRVEVDQLRNAVNELNVGEPFIQYQKDLAGNEVLQITTAAGTGDKVEQALNQKFPDAKFDEVASYSVGPTVGAQILRTAIIATLLALLGILVYVAMRYEFSFALGAVVAIFHDVLMTLGWFCLTGREFSAPMVAAILTIIGFSINDTIVIFDRIREDLKLGMRGSFKDIINTAINQTLSRTIITSGTVLLATLALYIFGGPVINDFAFTFLVGILVGTYSTIYIASAFVYWWNKGERPRTATQVVMEGSAAARA